MTDLDDFRAKVADTDAKAVDLGARVSYHLAELRGALSLLLSVADNPNTTPDDIAEARRTLAEFESILTTMQQLVPDPPPHTNLN